MEFHIPTTCTPTHTQSKSDPPLFAQDVAPREDVLIEMEPVTHLVGLCICASMSMPGCVCVYIYTYCRLPRNGRVCVHY